MKKMLSALVLSALFTLGWAGPAAAAKVEFHKYTTRTQCGLALSTWKAAYPRGEILSNGCFYDGGWWWFTSRR